MGKALKQIGYAMLAAALKAAATEGLSLLTKIDLGTSKQIYTGEEAAEEGLQS